MPNACFFKQYIANIFYYKGDFGRGTLVLIEQKNHLQDIAHIINAVSRKSLGISNEHYLQYISVITMISLLVSDKGDNR